jgi:hypothetical protein
MAVMVVLHRWRRSAAGIALAVLAAFLPVRAGGSLWWHDCPHHFGALVAAAGVSPAPVAAPAAPAVGADHHDHAAHHGHHAAAATGDVPTKAPEPHGEHGDNAAGCTCTAYDCGGHGIALATPALHLPTPIAGEEQRIAVVPALLPRAVRWTLPFAQGPPAA